MVTFKFTKKSYEANERDAVRLLNYYRHWFVTWQVVKAWRVKGKIKNTPGQDRRRSQGFAGPGKVVGYSTGKSPNQINALMLNHQIRETQQSVKVALTGVRSIYGQNLAVLYEPTSFSARGSKSEFFLNLFFTKDGLIAYERQRRL